MTKSVKVIRVCMLIDAWFPFVGGGQIHVKNLIEHLKTRHPVKVFLYHSPHHHIIVRLFWNLWVIPQVILSHKKNKFHLIHAHAYSAGLSGKILSMLLNTPIVYTVHGSNLLDTNASGIKAWGEKVLLTKNKYNHQISVTKSFLKHQNINKHISVIPNGVNTKLFDKYNVPKRKKFTLLYVGRTQKVKGLHILKAAYSRIKHEIPDINFKLVTNGALRGKSLIKQYKQSHVFILPSLSEGLPLVLLEAWAAKLPVIATKTSGVKEIATHKKNAILVQPNNVSQLASAIRFVYKLSSPARSNLGMRGYKKVKKEFNWSQISNQTFNIYRHYAKK